MKRKIGVLCHITSLPSKYGIGDLGQESYKFVDFLYENNFNVWQILPLNKINAYNSPYGTISCFAYEELLLDIEPFIKKGLVSKEDIDELLVLSKDKVEYNKLKQIKMKVLTNIYLQLGCTQRQNIEDFLGQNPEINEYCIFQALREYYNVKDWRDFPQEIKSHKKTAIKKVLKNIYENVLKFGYFQMLFSEQFEKLKAYAHSKNIVLMGDVAIYCEPASCDVWAHKNIFKLDKQLNPLVTGGVPDGLAGGAQNWQTCVFDWKNLKRNQYSWWIDRIHSLLKKFDILRLDHFMGFIKHYEIPFGAQNCNGHKWVTGGGIDFFDALFKKVSPKSIVVEDMGDSPKECKEIISKYKFRDMRMLLYAFDNDSYNTHLPHTIKPNTIYYIGTHDNKTLVGYVKSLSEYNRNLIKKYFKLNENCNDNDIVKTLIKALVGSKSTFIIFRTQDLLFEDDNKRMNTPGIAQGQWEYRLPYDYVNRYRLLNLLDIKLDNC